LEPAQGLPGTLVTLTGTGYETCLDSSTPTAPTTPPPGLGMHGLGGGKRVVVDILWDRYTKVGETVISESGWIFTRFKVPAQAQPRVHTVYAQCMNGEYGAATFTVISASQPTTTTATEPQPTTTTTTGEPTTSTMPGGLAPTRPPGLTTPPGPTTPPVTPTATTTPTDALGVPTSDHPSNRSLWPRSVRTPAEVGWNLLAMLRSLTLAAALVLLIGFPAEIFNKTFEKNKDTIHRWFRWLPTHRIADLRIPAAAQLAAFAVIAAALTALVDPKAGLDAKTAALVLGLVVAFVVATLAYGLSGEAYAQHVTRLPAVMRLLPLAVIVAIGCALLSRLAHFIPGYAYGLFVAFVAARPQMQRDQSGHTVLISSVVMLGISLVAWFGWQPVSAAAERGGGFGILVADAVLCGIFVLGIQNVVFGLIPLQFLDGHNLFNWRSAYWFAVYILGAFGFVHVLLHPKTAPQGVTNEFTVTRAAILFVSFGLASLLFWGYFKIRSARTAAPAQS
jgi:hypothetical protein